MDVMSHLLSVLTILAISVSMVTSEGCQYHFTVPETSGAQCNTASTIKMQHNIDLIQSRLITADQRQVAMSEGFKNEMTRLETEARDMRNISTRLRMDLEQMKAVVSRIDSLGEEVKGLRDIITNPQASMEQRFSELQKQMMSIVQQFQNQAANMTQQIQGMILGQSSLLSNHAETLMNLQKTSAELTSKRQEENALLADISERLKAAEETLDMDPPISSQFHRLKSSLNLLQMTYTAGFRQNRDQIQQLQSQLDALKKPN